MNLIPRFTLTGPSQATFKSVIDDFVPGADALLFYPTLSAAMSYNGYGRRSALFYFYNVIPWCWITFYCSHALLKKAYSIIS